MKKLLLATSIAAVSASTTPLASAGETATGAKQTAAITTSAIIGGAAGGPIGLFIGTLMGGYISEQIGKADGAKITELELAEKEMQVAELKTQLLSADSKVGELSEIALDKLEFQVLFHTGADQLTDRGKARVSALASFLQKHPGLSVRLTGHADPRGTDEYNNVLSDHRAISVQQSLIAAGIQNYRIERRAVGANLSRSLKGDYESYAIDRRVDIEIFSPVTVNAVVQAH